MRVNQYNPATAPVSPKPGKHTSQSMRSVTAVDNAPVRLSGAKQSVGKDDLNKLEDGMKNLMVEPGEYQRPSPLRNERREAPFEYTAPKQLQTEQTPATSADPASELTGLLASVGVKLTSTNDAEEMIKTFALHVQATLASKEFLYQKKLYLIHITRLLDITSSHLSKLASTKEKRSALRAVSTYKSYVENDLEKVKVLLEQEEGPSAYQRPPLRNERREARS